MSIDKQRLIPKLTCSGCYEAVDPIPEILEKLAWDIRTGTVGRPEFYIEMAGVGNGEVGSVHVGALFPCDIDSLPDRWCLTYAGEGGTSLCLAQPGDPDDLHRWYIYCGAEHEILDCCAIHWDLVRQGVEYFCHNGSMGDHLCIDIIRTMNL